MAADLSQSEKMPVKILDPNRFEVAEAYFEHVASDPSGDWR